MADTAETIKEGAAALPAVAQYFPVVISLLLLFGGGYLLKSFMDAEVAVLRGIEAHLSDLDNAFRESGINVEKARQHRLAAQAAAAVSP